MMDPAPRKVRPDATLRQLPEERQLEIYERLAKDSAAKVRKWLAKDGLDVGSTALYVFYQYWSAELRFRKAEEQRLAVLERMTAETPDVPLEQVEAFADAVFLKSATAEGDLSGYVKVRRITENSKRTRLEGRRITILERKAAQADAAKDVLSQQLSAEEQNRRLREILK